MFVAIARELIGLYHVKRFSSVKLLHGCLVSVCVNSRRMRERERWRTRGADAWHSCHVFPLFFPSTIKHFVLSSSFACYDSENIALIFHPPPLFFSPPSSYLFLSYPFILRCLPMLRSFIEFISIYVPRCKVAMIKTGSRRAMKYEYVKDFICQPMR